MPNLGRAAFVRVTLEAHADAGIARERVRVRGNDRDEFRTDLAAVEIEVDDPL